MKNVLWISFALLLLFSMTAVFGQTDQSAVSSDNNEEAVETTTQKPRKVSEVRKVTRVANLQKVENGKSTKGVTYDAKGGIVVPGKSEGIQQTRLTPAQQKKLEQIQRAENKDTAGRTEVEKVFEPSEKKKGDLNQTKKSSSKQR